jgi:hypothetical protein
VCPRRAGRCPFAPEYQAAQAAPGPAVHTLREPFQRAFQRTHSLTLSPCTGRENRIKRYARFRVVASGLPPGLPPLRSVLPPCLLVSCLGVQVAPALFSVWLLC